MINKYLKNGKIIDPLDAGDYIPYLFSLEMKDYPSICILFYDNEAYEEYKDLLFVGRTDISDIHKKDFGNSCILRFTAESPRDWYIENYLPLCRMRDVKFFNEYGYVPHMYKDDFVYLQKGTEIEFYGDIRGTCNGPIDYQSPAGKFYKEKHGKEIDGDVLTVIDDYKGWHAPQVVDDLGNQYYIYGYFKLFDYDKFIKEYIEPENPDYYKDPECINHEFYSYKYKRLNSIIEVATILEENRDENIISYTQKETPIER